MHPCVYLHVDGEQDKIEICDNTATDQLQPAVRLGELGDAHATVFLTRQKLTELVEKGAEWLAAHPEEEAAERAA